MPTWPARGYGEEPVFLSTADEWARLSGRQPTFASVHPNGVVLGAVLVRAPMTLKRLWVQNGTVVGGKIQMSLYCSDPAGNITGNAGPSPQRLLALSDFALQGSANLPQYFNIDDVCLSAGLYWVGVGMNATALATLSEFLCAYTQIGATSLEGYYGAAFGGTAPPVTPSVGRPRVVVFRGSFSGGLPIMGAVGTAA